MIRPNFPMGRVLVAALIPLGLSQLGQSGCAPDCPDLDGDGLCDADDLCPDDPLNDADGDGLCDSTDPQVILGLPRDFAVLQRANQLCTLRPTVTVNDPAVSRVRMRVFNGDALLDEAVIPAAPGAPVAFSMDLAAGLRDYSLVLSAEGAGETLFTVTRDEVACGDLLLIQGQSNAVAADYHSEHQANLLQSHWIRTFGSASLDPATVAADLVWDLADGEVVHDHAMVGTWGLRMASRLVAAHAVPIGLLNGAVGGTTIAQHQRNDADPDDLNTIYGRFLFRAREAGFADRASLLVWYQGESDGTLDPATYTAGFEGLWADWQQDFPALADLYLFQVRAGCGLIDPPMEGLIQLDFYDASPTLLSSVQVPLLARQGWSQHPAAATAPAGSALVNVIVYPFLAGAVDFDDLSMVDGAGVERLTNTSLEDGLAFPTGWAKWGDGRFDWLKDGGHTGSRAMRLNNNGSYALLYQQRSVSPGDAFQATVWARDPRTTPWTDTRETLRDLAASDPRMHLMSTIGVPGHDGCHFYYAGYEALGDRIFNLIDRDRYGSGAGPEVDAPQPVSAAREGDGSTVRLSFAAGSGPFTVQPGAEAWFLVEGGTVVAAHGEGDSLVLSLDRPATGATLGWLGHPYDGPAIFGGGGVGMTVFMGLPVD